MSQLLKHKKVMLDLETLATESDAVIASIGAVQFDPLDGVSQNTFYKVLELQPQIAAGRSVMGGTIEWWMGQSPEARRIFTDKQQPKWYPDVALVQFADWLNAIDQEPIEIWGNGADFDNVILGGLYKAFGRKRPWSYGMNRCYRTLKNQGIPLGAGEGIEFQGTAHNALADAQYQAHYACVWLRKLAEKFS